MNYYFLVLLCLDFLGLGFVLSKHGEQRDDKYNFFATFVSTSIRVVLIILAIKKGL